MATKKNKSLQPTPPPSPQKRDDEKQEVITPEVVLPSSVNVPLINAEIVQILLKENNQEEIERLMKADLDYNEKRLAIIRQHAAEHPDAIEARKTRQSGRTQYTVLLGLAVLLLLLMPSVSLAIAIIFGTIVTLIVGGILVNARERELDLQGFIKLINVVIGREK